MVTIKMYLLSTIIDKPDLNGKKEDLSNFFREVVYVAFKLTKCNRA